MSALNAGWRAAGLDGRALAMAGALVLIWIAFDLASEGVFLSARNLYNLAVQSSVVGVMATGMVFVIVARHIDLSVGSLLGFTGMAMAVMQVEVLPVGASWNAPLSLAVGLGLGAAIGGWHGYWVAYRGLPAFVVTLAGLLIFRGGAYLLTDGRTVAPLEPRFQLLGGGLEGSIGATWSWLVGLFAIGLIVVTTLRARSARSELGSPTKPLAIEIGLLALWSGMIVAFVLVMNAYTQPRSQVARGIPVPVLILIVVAALMRFLAQRTRFGRHVFAIGGSPEAAALSGIDVKRITLRVFVVMGILSAIAGAITAARLDAGTNSMGTLAELSVIAAAVIGGTSLAGGVGSVGTAILGAVMMQSLENGMLLLGLSSPVRQILIGLVLLVAVWIDSVYRRRRQ